MTYTLINQNDLPHTPTGKTTRFEGYLYNDTSVSFFLVDVVPGKGAQLHVHPYEEIHILREGQATYTVGDEKLELVAGQIVIVPPNTPHGFVNSGTGSLKVVSIHPVAQMIQTDLETSPV